MSSSRLRAHGAADIVQCRRVGREQMRLRVVDHLHAMLNRPQEAVGSRKFASGNFVKLPGRSQRLNGIEGRCGPNCRVATAMDHLLDLNEELDLADSPAPALEVVAGSQLRSLRQMVANSCGDLPHFLDYAEIERAAPHKEFDRAEETLAERNVARGGTGPDEGRAFPRQGA